MSPLPRTASRDPQKARLPRKKRVSKQVLARNVEPAPVSSWWGDSWHWVGLGLTGLLSPFTFVALTIPAWTGQAGAWLSQGLYNSFGISALLLPAVTAGLGLHFLLPRCKRPLQLSWAPTLMWLDLVWLAQRMGQQGGLVGLSLDNSVVAMVGPLGSWMGAGSGLLVTGLVVCRIPLGKVISSLVKALGHSLECVRSWAHNLLMQDTVEPVEEKTVSTVSMEASRQLEVEELPRAPEVRSAGFLSIEVPVMPNTIDSVKSGTTNGLPVHCPPGVRDFTPEVRLEDELVPLVPFDAECITFHNSNKDNQPELKVKKVVEMTAPLEVDTELDSVERELDDEVSLEAEASIEADEESWEAELQSQPCSLLEQPQKKLDAEEVEEFVSEEKEADLSKKSDAREVFIESDGQMRLFPTVEKAPSKITYRLPSLSLLDELPASYQRPQVEDKSVALLDSLASFGVQASLLAIVQGPTVTRYELQPARGVKVSRFTSLTNDIALALAAKAVRIEAPIPGKSAIGIEIPNEQTELVVLRDILSAPKFRKSSGMSIALGKDLSGTPTFAPLQKMPHLLVAGTTGSGKSVCVNGLIMSLLYRFTPRELQLLMIDPKQVELSIYEGIPHLISLAKGSSDSKNEGAIICDPKRAALALNQIVELMEFRYGLFASSRVRNLDEYNQQAEEPLPWVVVLIDELADLMMVASKSVETSICRIAQKARAAGIHLVLATQRPSADVITGLIKVNVPSRIAFAVSSQVDSRVILDTGGAEQLLGKGDMLFCPVDASVPRRLQGCFVTNDEILRVVEWWRGQGVPDNQIQLKVSDTAEEAVEEEEGDADDLLVEQALSVVLRRQQASASLLQTELKVGYARARRLVYLMEKKGYIGPAEGSKPRKILINRSV